MTDPQISPSSIPAAVPKPPPHPSQQRFGILRTLMGIGAVVMLFIVWKVITSQVVYTADAYVRSDLISLAPQITGHVVSVAVADNEIVHKGDLLIQIDPEPFQLAVNAALARLQQAHAMAQAGRASKFVANDQLDAATAQLSDAQSIEKRIAAIAQSGAVSRDEQDQALAASRSSQASVAANRAIIDKAQSMLTAQQASIVQAQAELASAEWRLARTRIESPADGAISNLNVQVGDTANADQPLIGIIASPGWRIIANYKQSHLSSLHPGATVWVWLDTHPWHFYRGRIRSVARGINREQLASGLLPYVTPTTDWIRLQHRFPVTIDLVDPPADLTLYMGADARTVVFP